VLKLHSYAHAHGHDHVRSRNHGRVRVRSFKIPLFQYARYACRHKYLYWDSKKNLSQFVPFVSQFDFTRLGIKMQGKLKVNTEIFFLKHIDKNQKLNKIDNRFDSEFFA
jgi:hypothetical protein